ncbi:WD40 repeat-like protein [Lactarius akahatsu]|uniref:WD40 repeat-like protein n=1 Tax=Lactarius akahatsu TaxID=416441 RepID=A0AAD4LKP6_9AGAM|nr:WD40 repeat-like protein [Lactarius akahatsu]
MADQDQYVHLKEIFVEFIEKRPTSDLELVLKDDAGIKHKSSKFKKEITIHWNTDIYVRTQTGATLIIQRSLLSLSFAEISVKFKPDEFGDDKTVSLEDTNRRVTVNFICGRSKSLADVTRVLGSQACTALASKVNMLDSLDKILGFLKLPQLAAEAARLNPIALIAVSVVKQAIVNFQEIPSCHRQFVILMDDLVSMLPIMLSALETVEVAERRAIVRGFIEFVKETSEQLNKYSSRSAWTFVLENWYNSKRRDVDALKEKSTRLKQNVGLAINVDIKEHLLLKDREQELKRIKPPAGSSFDPDPKYCCMPGTRADLIETLTSFAVSEDASQRLFFLSGIAGCGKSSVATSVANSLHLRGCLSGSFFFKRDKGPRGPANLLHTMAYSIALRHEPYRKALMDVFKTNTRIEDEAPSIQFNALFKYPLDAILNIPSITTSHSPPDQAIVAIVIDALDECDDPRSVSSYLVEIVGLAPWLRVIVTSRPLDDIEPDLRRAEYVTHLNLFTVDASEDILKFTQSSFALGGLLHRLRSQVTEEEIQALAERSHGLFIWIKTVLSYIASLPWDAAKLKEMRSVLTSRTAASPEKDVDELYLRVLRSVAGKSLDYRDAVKSLVGSIYVTSRNRSLPCKGLHAFIPTSDPDVLVTPEDVDDLRSKLAAVITVDPETEALRVCHPSFLDFVETHARSQEFWTKPEALDMMMARSRQRNDEIPDLKLRIPQELQYSAVYWLDHLSRSDELLDVKKLNDAHDFLCHARLFYWLEVLSVVSEVNAAAQTLRKLVVMSKDDHETCETFRDFLRFVLLLRESMSVSVPHIYISSVIWAEPWSTAMKFLPFELQITLNRGPGTVTRPTSAGQLNVGSVVNSVACSPDGRQIVTGSMDNAVRVWDAQTYSPDGTNIISASYDCTVRIWDSQTGVHIGEPLRGHTLPLTSVAYSPDGTYFISGSMDKTVRIWNSQTGTLVGKPLQGPSGQIMSVAYSPDGTRIICGSDDTRVWMWDSQTGELIGNPFEGHTEAVLSVAYSPNGNIVSGSKDGSVRIWDSQTGSLTCGPLHLALRHAHLGAAWVLSVACSPVQKFVISGSMENTVRVWDLQTGKLIGNPLSGHGAMVTSVAYSQDMTCIISGSFDGTVYIWDPQTEMPRGLPPKGHRDQIKTIAYSRDGRCIVSGSCDKTIQIWDSRTGFPIDQPLRGHTSDVASIAFSPDETHIVSASWDHTLQIWNYLTGAPVGIPLKGHTYTVLSVAYSPDGTQIVSGSQDNTVLIWDPKTCAPIKGPLRGHTGPVSSVAYSSDGALVLSGSHDHTIIIWDLFATQEPLKLRLEGHTGPIYDIACSPTRSHVVSGSSDKTIQIWDFQTGKPVYEPLIGHTGGVMAVAYSPDGNHIVSAGNTTIRIWDSLTGALIGTPLNGHTAIVLQRVAKHLAPAFFSRHTDIQNSRAGFIVK